MVEKITNPIQGRLVAKKHCTLCRRYLPETDFYKKGVGRHAYCKLCHWDRTRELRAEKKACHHTTKENTNERITEKPDRPRHAAASDQQR